MNNSATPTDSIEAWTYRVAYLADNATDAELAAMAISERNEILDEIRRSEETRDARAEERRTGYWAIPTHVRKGLGLL